MRTGNAFPIVLDFVAIHTNFVASNDCLKAIVLAEFLSNVGSELHSNSSFAGSSTGFILRVSPQHLHHETSLTRLSLVVSIELSNIVQRYVVIREQTAVENKILLANQCGQWKSRKTLREELEDPVRRRSVGFPQILSMESSVVKRHAPFVVFGFALSLKSVDAIHVIRLMVAAIEEETIWSQPFVGVQ